MSDTWVDSPTAWADRATAWPTDGFTATVGRVIGIWSVWAASPAATAQATAAALPAGLAASPAAAVVRTPGLGGAAGLALAIRPAAVATGCAAATPPAPLALALALETLRQDDRRAGDWRFAAPGSRSTRLVVPLAARTGYGAPLPGAVRFPCGNPNPETRDAMEQRQPYVGTVGFVIDADCRQDISAATNPYFLVRKPSGATGVWTAAITTIDEATRFLRHTTVAGELNEVGDYKIHACLTLDGWSGPGEVGTLTVRALYS